jgi:nucleotide-binding universal stress UspA family protein
MLRKWRQDSLQFDVRDNGNHNGRRLYATDFSDASLAALPQVSTMARRYGSRVFVVNVWTPAPYSMVSPEAASALQHKDEREARAKARELLNRRELAGLPATVIVQTVSPPQELTRAVREKFAACRARCSRLACAFRRRFWNTMKSTISCFLPIFRKNPGTYFRMLLPSLHNTGPRSHCCTFSRLTPKRTQMPERWLNRCAGKWRAFLHLKSAMPSRVRNRFW